MSRNVNSASISHPESEESIINYKDVFKFGEHNIQIPFEKLDDLQALQSIDLTYFQAKCREVLKHVYDNCFKDHKQFTELKNYLIQNELEQNLVKQVFLRGVNNNDVPE